MMRVAYSIFWTLVLACLFQACSVSRLLPEDGYLLDKVVIRSDSASLSPAPLQGYIRQHPNSKWFSLFKVPMGIYSLSGRDSTKRINRFVRRLGARNAGVSSMGLRTCPGWTMCPPAPDQGRFDRLWATCAQGRTRR